MALPGMDLQSQYNQTLQNTIGQSQSERLRQTRQQQSLANTDWSQRGVGEGAKRMAGFQEVNPSSMPAMSEDTRSFVQPLLGTYQEGGKNVEGFYGKDNPYTQGGLESIISKQGYARAPSLLSEQFKEAGLKLPNAYGQEYYNAQHEDIGNKIGQWKLDKQNAQRQYDAQLADYNARKAEYDANYQQQLQQYNTQKAIQDQQQQTYQKQIDDLYSKVTASTAEWQNRYGPAKESIEKYTKYGFTPGKDNGAWRWISNAPLVLNNRPDEFGNVPEPDWSDSPYEKGSGHWLNDNGQFKGINYTPSSGFWESDFDHKATGMGKIMPALTMAALGAITGGAGYAAAGGSGALAGAVGGMAGALPSTLATGLNTGDWGKALTGMGMGAVTGGLGSYVAPTLQSVVKPAFESLNLPPILASTLTNAGSKAILSAGGTGLSNLLSNNKMGNNVGMSAVQGALSGLGNLFAPEGSTPKQQQAYGQLASTGARTLANVYNQNKRK